MLEPSYWDWHIWAGNNLPQVFRVPEGPSWADLTGATMHLWIRWPDGEIHLVSGQTQIIDGIEHGIWIEDQSDPLWLGIIGVRLTLDQSRLLPTAAPWARYEIERRNAGEQGTDFYGDVHVTSWLNGDE